MRTASSGSLVPAIGLAEGAGEAALIDAAECAGGSGEGDAVADREGACEGWGEAAAEDTMMGGAKGEPSEEEVQEAKVQVRTSTSTHWDAGTNSLIFN